MGNSDNIERLDALVSSFDFKSCFAPGGGSMKIQLEKGRIRKYGFGELCLMPYLQRAFKRDEDLTVEVLKKRIKNSGDDARWLLWDEAVDLDKVFYESLLEKMNRDALIHLTTPTVTPTTQIQKGNLYNSARVKEKYFFEDIPRLGGGGNNM